MSSHPATAARSFASGAFSQRGERLRVDEIAQSDKQENNVHRHQQQQSLLNKNNNGQHHHDHHQQQRRHDPPSRGPSFGSLSSGLSDSISSLGNSRFGRGSPLRRAPSFSFILKFDNNNIISHNNRTTTGTRVGGDDDLHHDHQVQLQQQELVKQHKTTMKNNINDKSRNKKLSIKEILYILEKLFNKYHIIILITIAILLARVYPPLGATYVLPHVTSSWIAVMEIFSKLLRQLMDRLYLCVSIIFLRLYA